MEKVTMINFVALYKVFEGHEFLYASLDSIYDFCDRIVIVSSDKSWNNEEGNTVIEKVKQYKEEKDNINNKIHIIEGSFITQESQYQIGLDYIKNNFNNIPYVLIIDTDEVYEKVHLETLRKEIEKDNFAHDAFSCRMFTYVRSMFYKVEPIEPCCPTIVIKNNLNYFSGIRGSGVQNRKHLDNVFFHHFCYVRDSIETIKRKYINSSIGDKAASVNWEYWYNNKWLKLPNCEDFHPTKNREYCWKSIKEISKNELPETIIKNNF
jgi:hypothetical protein